MTTATQRLSEAKEAYHRLMTGSNAVEIRDATGETVIYSKANAASLRSYISQLEAEIAGSASTTTPGRPMGVWF